MFGRLIKWSSFGNAMHTNGYLNYNIYLLWNKTMEGNYEGTYKSQFRARKTQIIII